MTWWQFLISVALVAIPTVSVLMVGLDYSLQTRSSPLGALVGGATIGAAVGTSVTLALVAVQIAT